MKKNLNQKFWSCCTSCPLNCSFCSRKSSTLPCSFCSRNSCPLRCSYCSRSRRRKWWFTIKSLKRKVNCFSKYSFNKSYTNEIRRTVAREAVSINIINHTYSTILTGIWRTWRWRIIFNNFRTIDTITLIANHLLNKIYFLNFLYLIMKKVYSDSTPISKTWGSILKIFKINIFFLK